MIPLGKGRSISAVAAIGYVIASIINPASIIIGLFLSTQIFFMVLVAIDTLAFHKVHAFDGYLPVVFIPTYLTVYFFLTRVRYEQWKKRLGDNLDLFLRITSVSQIFNVLLIPLYVMFYKAFTSGGGAEAIFFFIMPVFVLASVCAGILSNSTYYLIQNYLHKRMQKTALDKQDLPNMVPKV